jgi:hypothetical protein
MGRTSQEVGVMPKETIHSRYDGQTVTVMDADGKERKETLVEPFLQIGWTREGEHVEVASRQGGDFDGDHNRPGFFVQLDRNGINRLIRLLRKARDTAYGADA